MSDIHVPGVAVALSSLSSCQPPWTPGFSQRPRQTRCSRCGLWCVGSWAGPEPAGPPCCPGLEPLGSFVTAEHLSHTVDPHSPSGGRVCWPRPHSPRRGARAPGKRRQAGGLLDGRPRTGMQGGITRQLFFKEDRHKREKPDGSGFTFLDCWFLNACQVRAERPGQSL